MHGFRVGTKYIISDPQEINSNLLINQQWLEIKKARNSIILPYTNSIYISPTNSSINLFLLTCKLNLINNQMSSSRLHKVEWLVQFRGRGHGSICLCKCTCRQSGTTPKYSSICWNSPSPFYTESTARRRVNSPASSSQFRSGIVPFPSLFLLHPFLLSVQIQTLKHMH